MKDKETSKDLDSGKRREVKVKRLSQDTFVVCFPDDFMFELTKEEYASLRCKNSTTRSYLSESTKRVVMSSKVLLLQFLTFEHVLDSLRKVFSTDILSPIWASCCPMPKPLIEN